MKIHHISLKLLFLLGLFTVVMCQNEPHKHDEKEGMATAAAEAHEHEAGEAMEAALTPDQFRMAGIEIGKIQNRNLTGSIRVNGVLDVPPQNKVSISAPAPGTLKRSELLEGSRVRKGQVVAVLHNPEFVQWQQDYLETKHELEASRSELEYLEAEYRRQEELARENINAGKTLQSAKAQYNSLKSRISAMQARQGGQREKMRLLGINPDRVSPGKFQSQISLYSPINGYVTKVNVNPGKFVDNTEVLFEIVDTEHLHAELIVFEKDIPKLRIGQNVRFTLANETTERKAKVYLIGREIGQDRSIRVHCHLDKEDMELLPGMYLKAAVETGENLVPSLPEGALVSSEGKDYLFIVEEDHAAEASHDEETGKNTGEKAEEHSEGDHKANEAEHHFKMMEVQRGVVEDGYVELLLPSGFDLEKTQVATKGAFYLLSAVKAAAEGEEGHAH
jgi:cobalt-zinc-cadmium efflux system membrane fusion protein